MTPSRSGQTPLARLVLFMVCLSIAGSILAGAHYYAVDLPQQNTLQEPENAGSSDQVCSKCKNDCKKWLPSHNMFKYHLCMDECQKYYCSGK